MPYPGIYYHIVLFLFLNIFIRKSTTCSNCMHSFIQLTLHKYTSAQSILFLSKVTCFDLRLVIFRSLQHFRYQMLCLLWDPIVFIFVEYILVKTF